MFIGHAQVREVLKNYQTKTTLNTTEYCMTGYEILEQAVHPYYEHALYIAQDPQILANLKPVKGMNLLILNPDMVDPAEINPKLKKTVNYTEIKTTELDRIRRLLRDYFDIKNGKGYLSDSILEHLFEEKGIQDMVDDFADAFNNPIYVFDAGYQLIAATWDLAEQYEGSKRVTESRRVTNEDWKIIHNDSPSDEEIMASREPLQVFHEEYGYRQLVVAIDPNITLGAIVVDEINRKFRNIDYDLLNQLRDGICQKMRLDSFVRNSKGYPYEYFIRDLLDKKINISPRFESRFDYVNKEFSNHMYCMVVETARSTAVLNLFRIRDHIEILFSNVKMIMYNGEMVFIFPLKETESLSEEKKKKLSDICRDNKIFAGLSNHFNAIINIFDYYKQALKAIELGVNVNNNPGLFVYENYSLDHIAETFRGKEDEKVFCHPKMKALLAFDKENNTELAYSLYMYLLYERNSAAAAKAMFIHRNTLVYRLQKIDDIVEILYEDPNERQYLIMSYPLVQGSSILYDQSIAECK